MKKIYLMATIAALITGIAVYLFISQQQSKEELVVPYETKAVVVAAYNIPENTKLTPDMLTSLEIPVDAVVDGVVIDMGDLVGKTTKYPTEKGEQLFYNKVAEIGDTENKRLSDRIKAGYRAFTIYVDEVSGLAGYLRTGDRVDMLVTKTAESGNETSFILQNIPIIAVGASLQYASGVKELNSYSNITLEVSAQDCLMLSYNISGGLVSLVLRGYGDDVVIETPAYSEMEIVANDG